MSMSVHVTELLLALNNAPPSLATPVEAGQRFFFKYNEVRRKQYTIQNIFGEASFYHYKSELEEQTL